MKPVVNIGMVGHVDHGKTTLVSALSGTWTDKHSEEIKRGISIRLGYADATFRRCPECDEPECYTVEEACPTHDVETEVLRTVSFVDSPGHETLMATMLSGAAIMDGAILIIAANEPCPQPQTKEHLMALDIIGIENIVVVQNKIDLVSREDVVEHHEQIKEFIQGTVAENAPIVPISAQQQINIDLLIDVIEETIPTPERDLNVPSRMFVARSFDVNKPGFKPQQIKGGVLGGTLSQGMFRIGDEIEVRPGRKVEFEGRSSWEPITTEVTNLMAGGKPSEEATPGGLLGVGTLLDPAVTKSDSLTGQIAGKPGTLPPVWQKFVMDLHLLDSVVGAMDEATVEPVRTTEPLMLNVGTATTVGVVRSARDSTAEVVLKRPVCAPVGSRIAISRRIGSRWRLIGMGTLIEE